jgi:hypothetical protein
MSDITAVGDNDPWETGELGESQEHVRVSSPERDAAVDESLGLTPISFRIQRELLKQLKEVASYRGIGYQPMIRDVLSRWVGTEMLAIVQEMRAQKELEAENTKRA